MSSRALVRKIIHFSLIELLVVVAILVVLMSLLSPSLKSVFEHQTLIACKKQQRAMFMGMSLFVDDHDQKFWFTDFPAKVSGFDPSIHYSKYGQNEFGALFVYKNNTPYTFEGITMTKRRPVGLGALLEKGYIQEMEVFFCPSQEPFDESLDLKNPHMSLEQAKENMEAGVTVYGQYVMPNILLTDWTLYDKKNEFPKIKGVQSVVCGSEKPLGFNTNNWGGDLPVIIDLWSNRPNPDLRPHDYEKFNVTTFDGAVQTYDNLEFYAANANWYNYGVIYQKPSNFSFFYFLHQLRERGMAY